MQSRRQVAVLVESSTGWGRRLIQGILRYAHQHANWQIWVEPRGRYETVRPPPGWDGDGVIARITTRRTARELQRLGVPIVNVSGISLPGLDFPTVTTDQATCTKLAADHFVDRGFQHFAYYGPRGFSPAVDQCRHFARWLALRGRGCVMYSPKRNRAGFDTQRDDLVDWLRGLPKPCAILCWGIRGLALLDACAAGGFDVPTDIAVVSSDYDDLFSEAANPPMTGIETPSDRIGQQAARLLDGLMRRPQRRAKKPLLIQPTRVIERRSSNVLAITDADLAAALRFIRDHDGDPIDVDAVLRHVACSRRSLERKFEKLLGRSPANEIRRVHLERAKRLLIDTDLTIPRVAKASGFGSGEYMSQAFRASVGLTPLRFRSLNRGRADG